jgi:tRNA(Ile)-lysidine synthase
MAMLASLCAVWRKEKLFCLHVNHSLRPAESLADAEFVANFCKERGIQCRVTDIPPGKIARFAKRRGTGIEAAARFFRRRAFFREAALLGDNVLILTAHTKDDLLETALMRVLRGAGPAGLAVMPVKNGSLLRPLLSITRAEAVEYLKAKNIPWREDSTNTDEKFLRNRIRRRLVPLLDESFPSWKAALSGMAETQSLVTSFLAEETRRRVIWESGKKKLIFTDEENFFAQRLIIREEAVFQGVDRLLAGREGSRVKRAVVRRFCAGNEAAADFGLLRARREGGKVVLAVKKNKFCESGFSLLIKEPGLYNLKKISIEVRPFSARNEEGAFTAALPLVFRRSFKDDFFTVGGKKIRGDFENNQVCALDVFGTAAFIGPRGLTAARSCIKDGQELFSVVISSNKTGGCDDKSQ